MSQVQWCKCGHEFNGHVLRGSSRSSWRGQCETDKCPCKRALLTDKRPDPVSRVIAPEERSPLYTLAGLTARSVVKIATGIKTFDEAMSGGFVKNSSVLLAGRRGCGKSTLMTVIAGAMAKKTTVLYVSGEEDVAQFAYRAKRLGVPKNLNTLHIMDSADLDLVWEYADQVHPGFIVIDSLQSLHGKDMNGMFVANKRTANYFTYQLKKLRKRHEATLILIGHETKQGQIAGDSSLQHEVDAVMQLDPDDVTAAKVLQIDKNRFGPAPATFRFLINDDGVEECKPIPSLDYKRPEIME